MLRTFKDLKVWQKSYRLCLDIYAISRTLPPDGRYGLSAQLRRAVVSVPSNIAEGYNRETTKDYLRFLWMAMGSLAELETQLLLAKDLKLSPEADVMKTIDKVTELQRMLRALIRSLKARETRTAPAKKPKP